MTWGGFALQLNGSSLSKPAFPKHFDQMKSIIPFFIFLLATYNTFSQSEYIYNTWISEGQMECADSTLSKIVGAIWSIQLKEDQTSLIRMKYLTRELEQNFIIEGNHIVMENRDLIIDEYRSDSLWLQERIEDKCITYLMISKDLIEEKQKQQIILDEGDSIYFAEFGNSPELEKAAYYEPHIRSLISNELRGVRSKVQINLSFVITRNGEMKHIKLFVNKETFKKKVMRILQETENNWTPMVLNDQPVSSLVQIKFKYQGH
jgi:hypothetical protein